MRVLCLIVALLIYNIALCDTVDPSNGFTVSGIVVDSATREPLVGVVVTLLAATDSTHAVTGVTGSFRGKHSNKLLRAEFTHLGYKVARVKFPDATTIHNLDTVRMVADVYAIEQVMVRARIAAIRYRGDTLIYNPKSVTVLSDAVAGDIVKKLPGLSVDNGVVTYGGQNISTAYVDGKRVFGTGTSALLENLDASDVASIELYQEKDTTSIDDTKKDWVLNFLTFSKLTQSLVGHLLTSYGADTQDGVSGGDRSRYGVGATVNFFSEKRRFSTNVFVNNLNRQSNKVDNMMVYDPKVDGNNRLFVVDLDGEIRSDKWSLGGGYSYDKRRSNALTTMQTVYFPMKDFVSRTYGDTTETGMIKENHKINAQASYSPNRKLHMRFRTNMEFSPSLLGSVGSAVSEQDGQIISQSVRTQTESARSYLGNYSVNGSYRALKWLEVVIGADLNMKESDADRMFSTMINTMRDNPTQNLKNADVRNTTYKLSSTIVYKLSPKLALHTAYSFSRNKGYDRQMVVDVATGLPDMTQTYDYDRNDRVIMPAVILSYMANKQPLTFELAHQTADIFQNNRTNEDRVNRTFEAFLPSVKYNIIRPKGGFSVMSMASYSTKMVVPGSNMITPYVDNSNPMRLKSGNPNLERSILHTAGVMRVSNASNSVFEYGVGMSYTQNPIINNTIFFNEDTPLRDHLGFVAPKGSELLSYSNAADAYTGFGSMSWGGLSTLIGCKYKFRLTYSYGGQPYSMNSKIGFAHRHAPKVTVGLESTFSSIMEFSLNSQTAYVISVGDLSKKQTNLTEQLNFNVKFLLYDNRINLMMYYNGYWVANKQEVTSGVSSNILNLYAGWNMGKKRMSSVGVSVLNVLNNTQSFSTQMTEQAMNRRWAYIPGTIFTINLSLKFNRTKSTSQLKLKDGGYAGGIESEF